MQIITPIMFMRKKNLPNLMWNAIIVAQTAAKLHIWTAL